MAEEVVTALASGRTILRATHSGQTRSVEVVLGSMAGLQHSDADHMPDFLDNCILTDNANQLDTDQDGSGNMCDADFNNNNVVDSNDASFLFGMFGKDLNDPAFRPDVDMNGNGVIDANDASRLFGSFGKPPGPSGLVP
jgi:hypothetical protein